MTDKTLAQNLSLFIQKMGYSVVMVNDEHEFSLEFKMYDFILTLTKSPTDNYFLCKLSRKDKSVSSVSVNNDDPLKLLKENMLQAYSMTLNVNSK